MAEREPPKGNQPEGTTPDGNQPDSDEDITVIFQGKVCGRNDTMEMADLITSAYDKLVQFLQDTDDYRKTTVERLSTHQIAISNLRTDLSVAKKYFDRIDKGLFEDAHLDELIPKVDDLWHTSADRLKALRVQALIDKQERAKKAQADAHKKKPQNRPDAQAGAEGGAREGDDDDVDEALREQTVFTKADKIDIELAYKEIDRLKDMVEDLLESQQLAQGRADSPRGYKKRPPVATLQKFKGSKKDYIRFQQSFKDSFEGVGLSKMSLAINLFEFLEGEPRSKLTHLVDNIDNNTYTTMWTCLDTFYGNEREKAKERFAKFETMPSIRLFNAGTISILITTLESNWQLLKQYSGDSFLKEDNIHLYMFLKKIPLTERDKFLDYCHFSSKRATFPAFKEWLVERWHRLKDTSEGARPDRVLQYWQDDLPLGAEALFHDGIEEKEEVVTSDWDASDHSTGGQGYYSLKPPNDENYGFFEYKDGKIHRVKSLAFQKKLDKPPTNRKPFSKGSPRPFPEPKKPQVPCYHCKKHGHATYTCEAFKALSSKERYNSVRENRLCLRCLNPGHIARECRMKFLCDIDKCGRKHHRLLHPEKITKALYQAYFQQGLESDLDSDDESKGTQN